MICVEICVGSSCCIKGSEEIIRLFREALDRAHIADRVDLTGCLCLGVCSRSGVNLRVDGEIVTGVTPENFSEFFGKHILDRLREEDQNV